jgi:hypothetical protein
MDQFKSSRQNRKRGLAMKGLLFIHRIGKRLTAYAEHKMAIERDGRMFCSDCGRAIHRGERFKVLSAQHNDCVDPKQVGQMAIGLGCPEPLRAQLIKEVANGD